MNINIYIENKIGQQLRTQAKTLGKTRNAVIREALQYWLLHHQSRTWPPIILNFHGDPKFPRLESYRRELKKTKEDPLS